MPTYNVEEFIELSIKSIQSQTYENFELIVIDDFSTDNTYNILRKFECYDNRIKLYRNKRNLKIVKTLNKALELSKGNFIARMDGDDIAMPDRLEKQLYFLLENPQYSLVGNHFIGIDETGIEIGESKFPTSWKTIDKTILLNTPVSHIWMARRELYMHLRGYRELPPTEDYDFLLRAKTEGYRFINIDYFGMKIRIREGNTVSSYGIVQRKANNYVRKLYKERRKYGKDSYTKDLFYKKIQVNYFLKSIHKYSNKFLLISIKKRSEKKLIESLLFGMFSLISPYQVQYLIRRLIYKYYIKKSC